MNFTEMKPVTVAALNKACFKREPKFMLKLKGQFDFYTGEAYGRAPAYKGLNIINWDRTRKIHVVTVLILEDGKYVLQVMDSMNWVREPLERFEFKTLKAVREFCANYNGTL